MHRLLEYRIGRLAVDRPVGNGLSEGHDPGTAVLGVLYHGALERSETAQASGQCMADGIADCCWIDGAEIEHRAQDVGTSNA